MRKLLALCVTMAVIASSCVLAQGSGIAKRALGLIASYSASGITVQTNQDGLQTFAITGRTEFRSRNNVSNRSEPRVGMAALVIADRNNPSEAALVELLKSSMALRASGIVTDVGDSAINVRTEKDGVQRFVVNDQTRSLIAGRNGSIRDLTSGTLVMVMYVISENGDRIAKSLMVRQVGTETPNRRPTETAMVGKVTAVTVSYITLDVNGRSFNYTVNPGTPVTDGNKRISCDMLAIGSTVTVYYTGAPRVATRIVVGQVSSAPSDAAYRRDATPVRNLASVSGDVFDVTGESITLTHKDGTAETIAVTAATDVTRNEKSAPITDVRHRDSAFIDYFTSDEGVKTAERVRDYAPTYSGRITAADDSSFTMISQKTVWTVTYDAATRIRSNDYVANGGDLLPGYTVTVRGDANGSIIPAVDVQIIPITFKGVVESVTGQNVFVSTPKGPRVVRTSNVTTYKLVDRYVRPGAKLSDVKPGLTISAGGHAASPDTIDAMWIFIYAPRSEGK